MSFFCFAVPVLYLRAPTMAGVQGGCVVLLYALIHAEVTHLRVTNLCKDKAFFWGSGRRNNRGNIWMLDNRHDQTTAWGSFVGFWTTEHEKKSY